MIRQFLRFFAASVSVFFAVLWLIEIGCGVYGVIGYFAKPVFDYLFLSTSPIRSPGPNDILICLVLIPMGALGAWLFGLWIPRYLLRPKRK